MYELEKPDQQTTNRGRSLDKPLIAAGAFVAAASLVGVEAQPSAAEKVATSERTAQLPNIGQHETKLLGFNTFEASSKEVVTSVKVNNGVAYINGKPAFLFGVYSQNTDWAINALNANVFIDSGENTTPALLAQQVQGRAWVLRQSRPAEPTAQVPNPPYKPIADPYPNEIGVAGQDESKEHGVSAAQFAQTPKDGRLTYGNFATQLSGIYFGISADQEAYAPYVAGLGSEAILGDDFYPVAMDKPDGGLALMYDYVLGSRMMAPNAIAETYVQTVDFPNPFTGESSKTLLTWQYMLGEAKAAITGGATMINWWDRVGGDQPESTSPLFQEKIRDFTQRIHELSPCLLGQQVEDFASAKNDVVKVGATTYIDGKGEPQYCVKLFNSADRPLVINQKLPGLTNQKITNAWNSNAVESKNGRATTLLQPEDWIIVTYPKNSEVHSPAHKTVHASSVHKKITHSTR